MINTGKIILALLGTFKGKDRELVRRFDKHSDRAKQLIKKYSYRDFDPLDISGEDHEEINSIYSERLEAYERLCEIAEERFGRYEFIIRGEKIFVTLEDLVLKSERIAMQHLLTQSLHPDHEHYSLN